VIKKYLWIKITVRWLKPKLLEFIWIVQGLKLRLIPTVHRKAVYLLYFIAINGFFNLVKTVLVFLEIVVELDLYIYCRMHKVFKIFCIKKHNYQQEIGWFSDNSWKNPHLSKSWGWYYMINNNNTGATGK
jgi:hypothetical protein